MAITITLDDKGKIQKVTFPKGQVSRGERFPSKRHANRLLKITPIFLVQFECPPGPNPPPGCWLQGGKIYCP